MIVRSEKTLDRFREAGCCELCRRHCERRHPHHVTTRGHAGGSRLDLPANLVGLCPPCHSLYGDDPDYKDVFLALVADREGFTSREAVQAYLWEVLMAPKHGPLPVAPVCPF